MCINGLLTLLLFYLICSQIINVSRCKPLQTKCQNELKINSPIIFKNFKAVEKHGEVKNHFDIPSIS